jgi:hypothetical protein
VFSWVRFATLGLLLAVPACTAETGDPADPGNVGGLGEEEPLDPMEGPDDELFLGKEDAAKRTLPKFDLMWDAFPHGSASEVKTLIGGNVNADWITNTCTIRVSRALNYAGFAIPGNIPGLTTVKGGDAKRYAFRVAELRRYFRAVLGPPTVTGLTPQDFEGKRGVIVFEVSGWSDASGHFDLWDGYQPAHAEYFSKASKVQLWVAP